MKKLLLTIVLILSACSKPIVVDRFNDSIQTIPMFGEKSSRSFYIDKSISDNIIFEWNNNTHGSFGSTTFLAYDSLIIIPDLGGRITTFNIESGKEIGELKYKGEIAQTPILINSTMVFIVNNLREGISTIIFYNLIKGDEIKEIELQGKFGTEMITHDNMVYLISEFGTLYKYSISGSLEWKKDLKTKFLTDPAADSKYFYAASVNGKLFKISLDNGEIVDKKKISIGFQSGITIDNKNLFVGDDNGNCFNLNKETFEVNWKFNTGTKIVQIPVYDDDNIYVGNLDGKFFSINKRNGALNWQFEADGLFNVAPLVFSNLIVQPNLLQKIHFIDKNNGRVLNEIEFDLRVRTSAIFHKERLFFGIDKGEVYCYSIN